MDALTKKKTDRFRYLNRLYEISEERRDQAIEMWEIGNELDLTRDETIAVVDYLNNENLLEFQGLGGYIMITHYGIIEVEKALSKPDTPTEYFPPINIINVENMYNSQIQQGTQGSSQTQILNQNDLESIKLLIEKIKDSLEQLQLKEDEKIEAEAEIQTIEAQLKSSKPKISILRESLKTLRNLVEGVTANALAAQILPLFTPLAVFLSGKH